VPDEIEARIRRLAESSEQAAIQFVFTELTVGITSCQIAKKRGALSLDISQALRQGEVALHAAEKYMWKFKMMHPEFDQMIALAERLRLELDSLRPQS